MQAAIITAHGSDLEIADDVEISGPGPDEVKVRISATGVCHSDLSIRNGLIPVPPPCVPGHEAAGVITEIGEAVQSLAVGDHVILSWVPPCGKCQSCLIGEPYLCSANQMRGMMSPHLSRGGAPVLSALGTGSFAEYTVVTEAAAIKIDDDIPLDVASLVGCAVMTGVGAAINTAKVVPGASVAVIGCGGVGMNVIQGARAAGAAEIVAVDLAEDKFDRAKSFGATNAVTPDKLGNGYDYVFEVIGRSNTIRQAWDATRRGGTTVVVGMGRGDDQVAFSAMEIFSSAKTLKGCWYGSADVRTDFHRILRMWKAGQLNLEGLISERTNLLGVNDAFKAMEGGNVIRTIIEF